MKTTFLLWFLFLLFYPIHSLATLQTPSLSDGALVPVGQFEAVGEIFSSEGTCTATLINDSTVLTAAHCVCPSDHHPDLCATRANFRFYDVFPVDDPETETDESTTRTNVTVSGNVLVHPEYGMRGWLREDIAWMTLDAPASQSVLVTPISLANPEQTPFVGDNLTVLGFGTMGVNCQLSSIGKQYMVLPVVSSDWGGILFDDPEKHTCPGDSGGPAINSNGQVVGVASWKAGGQSIYRPTSFSYNYILGYHNPNWLDCRWNAIEQGGQNSHQPTEYCPNGSFLTALDLDGKGSVAATDSPVVGQARCCYLYNSPTDWVSDFWQKVHQGPHNSHSMFGTWCPKGHFISGMDLDGCSNCNDHDAPLIGAVKCSKLIGENFTDWGSSYWKNIGRISHQANADWCLDGEFISQLDLDADGALSGHDSPIVGRVKCSTTRPAGDIRWTVSYYENNLDISRELSIQNALRLSIRVTGSTETGYDFLTLYDENGRLLKQYTGSIDDILTTQGEKITARLQTDYSINRPGFSVRIAEAEWHTGAYGNNADYSELLELPQASSMQVTVSGSTEANYDFLYVYDSTGTEVAKLSGALNQTFTVSGSVVRVRLVSDHSITYPGVSVTVSP